MLIFVFFVNNIQSNVSFVSSEINAPLRPVFMKVISMDICGGKVDTVSDISENGRENGSIELSSKLSSISHKKNGPPGSGSGAAAVEGVASTSGLASQTASGVLSGSGVLNARPGSATSSGILFQMVPTLDAEVAREYLEKVADLLLEFSRADTTVKSYMCSLSLLMRLFQMLSKLESPILMKVCLLVNLKIISY